MLLQPLARGGKQRMRDLKATYNKFFNWRWEELVNLGKPSHKKAYYGSEEARRAVALRLVRCGELARASKVVTSKGLVPATKDTIKTLESKHPSRSKNVASTTAPGKDSISLSKSLWFDATKTSPRGSSTGPSGWRFEHFKALVENKSTADYLFSACSIIAKELCLLSQ